MVQEEKGLGRVVKVHAAHGEIAPWQRLAVAAGDTLLAWEDHFTL